MCCKQGAINCMSWFAMGMFSIGLIIAASSPQWIGFTVDNAEFDTGASSGSVLVELGPFYGNKKECTILSDDGISSGCGKWRTFSVDFEDCDLVQTDDQQKFCDHMVTWRSLAITCLWIMLIGGLLISATFCCSTLTCGCCGCGSFNCIANALYFIEVILSIVCWSFVISTLGMLKDTDGVIDEYYMWSFWLFIVSATFFGGMAAIITDWGAEGSLLRTLFRCFTCQKDDN